MYPYKKDSHFLMQQKIITSQSAMSWFKNGGFQWRVDLTENTQKLLSDDTTESNIESKHCGKRINRKALAKQKYFPVWSDGEEKDDPRG